MPFLQTDPFAHLRDGASGQERNSAGGGLGLLPSMAALLPIIAVDETTMARTAAATGLLVDGCIMVVVE